MMSRQVIRSDLTQESSSSWKGPQSAWGREGTWLGMHSLPRRAEPWGTRRASKAASEGPGHIRRPSSAVSTCLVSDNHTQPAASHIRLQRVGNDRAKGLGCRSGLLANYGCVQLALQGLHEAPSLEASLFPGTMAGCLRDPPCPLRVEGTGFSTHTW